MKLTTINTIKRISNWCFTLCWLPSILFFINISGVHGDIESTSEAITIFWPLILAFGILISGFVLSIVGLIAGGVSNMSTLAKGLSASAEVLKITDSGTTVNDDPVVKFHLRVYPENAPPFEVEAQKLISRLEMHHMQQGMLVQVKYDPKNHNVAIASMAAPDTEIPVKEKTGVSVMMKEVGSDKVRVVQVVREVTGLGLKDAYDLVGRVPCVVKENVSEVDAISMMIKFEKVGAVCDIVD